MPGSRFLIEVKPPETAEMITIRKVIIQTFLRWSNLPEENLLGETPLALLGDNLLGFVSDCCQELGQTGARFFSRKKADPETTLGELIGLFEEVSKG